MKPLKTILVHLPPSSAFLRECLEGVRTYAPIGDGWHVIFRPESHQPAALVPEGQVAGGIGVANTPELVRTAVEQSYIFVNVSGSQVSPDLPQVGPDDDATGRMGAEHLRDLGLRHFGCIALEGPSETAARLGGFRDALAEEGYDCTAFTTNLKKGLDALVEDLAIWLQHLRKPCGLFCTMDLLSSHALYACSQAGYSVPEEVAIVGVDDDPLVCPLARPTLSSIRQPGRQVGYQAAQLLDSLMQGAPTPENPILLPPVGVSVRQSTSMLAFGDETLTSAIRFIRSNADKSLQVKDVMAHCRCSRTTLENRFRQALDRTPYTEIRRVRTEYVKRLLSDTHLTVAQVAERSGFGDSVQLCHFFRDVTGHTPGGYRRQFRLT